MAEDTHKCETPETAALKARSANSVSFLGGQHHQVQKGLSQSKGDFQKKDSVGGSSRHEEDQEALYLHEDCLREVV